MLPAFLTVLPLVLPAIASPDVDRATDLLRPYVHTGPWRYRVGDEPTYARADYDDALWPAHVDFRLWHQLGFQAETVWYRTELKVRALPGQDLALSILVAGAADVYVNDVYVGSHGIVGQRAGTFDEATFDLRAIPAAETLEVAVRLWAPWHTFPGGGGTGLLRVGDRPAVELQQAFRRSKNERAMRPAYVVASFMVVVGVIHGMLALRRRDPTYAWFALGTLFFGSASLVGRGFFSAWYTPFPGAAFLELAFQALGYIGLLQYTARFFGVSAWPAHVVSVLLLLRVPYVIDFYGGYPPGWTVSVVVVPGVAWVLWSIGQGLRRALPGARWVAAAVLSFLVLPVEATLRINHWTEGRWGWMAIATATFGLIFFQVVALAERFAATHEDLEATQLATRRFVPFEFLERIGRTNVRDVEKGDVTRTEMTILFLDVRGFTTIAERNGPERTFQFVNALWERMEPPIRSNGGFVHQFMGDGCLALFPKAQGAVQAAIDLCAAIERFDSTSLVGERIEIGIGLHTGTVMLGTIGGRDHLAAGVVADAVNLASRVEGLTKVYGSRVLLTGETHDRLDGAAHVDLREVDRVVAKGRTEPMSLFEVVHAERPEVQVRRREARDDFARALGHYRTGAFAEALATFTGLADDPAARVLIERCRRFVQEPPAGWTGVWRMESK